MTRNGLAGEARKRKEKNPELYCARKDCLWRTGAATALAIRFQ